MAFFCFGRRFRFVVQWLFFVYSCGKVQKKTRKLTHDEIKRKLIESLMMNDTIESNELTKKVQEVEDPEKAAELERV